MRVYQQLVLAAILVFSPYAVRGQRGCPSEGCDPRGLNCQTDFEITSSEAAIIWQLELSNQTVDDNLKTFGCVGNNINVVCKIGNSKGKAYVSVDALTGKAKWYDRLLNNPRLPIMQKDGKIIATDGHYLEMRMKNGSFYGTPRVFTDTNDTSSIHYVKEPNLFFFVSYQSGGIYLYDTSGMVCVESIFLKETDATTNRTVAVWKPVTRLIVNNEVEPPCTYFVAENNVTMQYRVYAVNFNQKSPYLQEKWHLDLSLASPDKSAIAMSQMIVKNSTIFYAIGASMPSALVINDEGNMGVIKHEIYEYTISFSSFDYPANTQRNSSQEKGNSLVWMSGTNDKSEGVILGWDTYNTDSNSTYKYTINLHQMSGLSLTITSSQIMIFGNDPENTTLVFAYTAFNRYNRESGSNPPGNYLVAVKPHPDGSVETLWSIYIGKHNGWFSYVVGQIIGVQESMLVAMVESSDKSTKLIGIKLGQ